MHIGNDFQCVGSWCCGGVAYGRSGGGACGVTATIVVVAMDGEMGPPDAGAFTTEWVVAGSKRLFLMTAIKSDLGGGLRRPNGGEIGGRAASWWWCRIIVGCSGEADGQWKNVFVLL